MTIITPNVPQPPARFPLLFTCTTLLFLLHPGRCQAPGKQDSPPCPSPIKNFTVGFLLPISGFHSIGERVVKKVSQQVFRDANEKCRVAGYYLDYHVADTGCNTGRGLAQLLRFHREDIAHLFVGPVCESVCEMMNPVLTSRHASWVSFGCRMSDPMDTTLTRTAATFSDLALFVIAVVNHFEWFKGYLALLTEATSSDDWLMLRQAFQDNLKDLEGIYAAISVDSPEYFAREMTDLVEKSFVFVLCMYPETAWDFLKMAKTLNYYRKGLVFIVFDFANFGRRMNRTMDLTGLLDITADVPYNSSSFDQFLDQVLDRNNNSSDDCDLDYELGIHPAQIADAVGLLIEGLNRSIKNPEYDIHVISQNVSRDLQNLTFQGVTGEIHIDNNRISAPRFLLNNLVSGCYYPVGRSQNTAQAASQVDYEVINSTIIWPGPTKVKPSCPKGLCGSTQDLNLVLFLYLLVVVLAVAVIIGLVIKRREMIRDMGRGDWIITSEDLYSVTGRKTSTTKTKRKNSLGGTDETQTMDLSQESLKTFAMGQIFTKVTVMDQQLVAIKQVNKDNIVLTNEVFVEVNQIRNLRHTNVNQLIGACVEPGNLSLVWGYASKGSLRDVLSNDTFRLDWMFKISFITDIAKGMAYIHSSPVNVHGRLKSSNVIVDKNWSCKITDISMPIFRQGEEYNVTDDWLRAYSLLWVAPELLRLSEYPVRATKKGDVYAFAIIMFEILTRSQPFGLRTTDNPEEIILRVLNEEKPPFRPRMPEGQPEISPSKLSDYGEVLDLMMMCWDEYPLFRLPFTTVSHNLKKIRQSAGTARNLADEMLAEMTKYTDLLETQVEERTMQIQDEQEKADELLARMLPKSVTHDLKMGKTVIPESYRSVTIFFSDIVGFTALAARSTPLQVVNLLNDLYTLFDKVVDDYDAYKIETIGDAYMVVSGLPVRNGDQHAAEIASVALRILSCVLGFKIRHCPDHHLLLRIGLHTGPVVAGVVGLKMPRYCLFGDTVNYAARMESSGKPLHIHISETCKSYLDRLGDFHAKERGMMDVMGTGKTKTYFLLGKVGLHVIAETLPQEIRDKVGINVTFVDDKKMIKQQ